MHETAIPLDFCFRFHHHPIIRTLKLSIYLGQRFRMECMRKKVEYIPRLKSLCGAFDMMFQSPNAKSMSLINLFSHMIISYIISDNLVKYWVQIFMYVETPMVAWPTGTGHYKISKRISRYVACFSLEAKLWVVKIDFIHNNQNNHW